MEGRSGFLGKCIHKPEVPHLHEKAAAYPGVRGCIDHLFLTQFPEAPVRTLRSFGNALSEEVRRERPKPPAPDFMLVGNASEVYVPRRREGVELGQFTHVLTDTDPCLNLMGIGEYGSKSQSPSD